MNGFACIAGLAFWSDQNLDDGRSKGRHDELFMREYIREWKRLMKAEPDIAIRREP
jgi:hypothetical protein